MQGTRASSNPWHTDMSRSATPYSGEAVRRFLRFALVGAAMTLLDLGLVAGAVEWAGIPVVLSYILSSIICILVSFLLNRGWTFRGRGQASHALLLFFLAYGIAAAVNVGTASALYLLAAVPYLLARIVGSAVALGTSYGLVSRVVFPRGTMPSVMSIPPAASPVAKQNVQAFNQDVSENDGYRYTTNPSYSSLVSNRRITDAVVERIPASARSLVDVGCGDGCYTAEMAERRPACAMDGFDPAEDAIRAATGRFPSLRFTVGNILAPATLPQKAYDVAVVRGVLHHLSDQRAALHNCTPLAELLIVVEPNGNNPIVKFIERASRYHREHEEQSFSSRALRQWCREAGWEVNETAFVGFVPFFFPTLPSKIIHFFQPLLEKIPLLRTIFAGQIVIVAHRVA